MHGKTIWLAIFRAIVCVSVFVTSTILVGSSARAANCTSTALAFVAHEDDDLLFMNPDIQNDIRAGYCTVTVYLTAGDAGNNTEYWQEREKGPRSAYSTMMGLSSNDTWNVAHSTFAGHTVTTATNSTGAATMIYLRLPDGGLQGDGFGNTGNRSLEMLGDGRISSLAALDGSATYTSSGLISTLAAIVAATNPTVVRVQDARVGQGDHADHVSAGQFAQEALIGYAGTERAYRGYPIQNEPVNVTGADLTRKTAALLSYAEHDVALCPSEDECPTGSVAEWNRRQYTTGLTVAPTPVAGPAPYSGANVARNASVLASSQASGQEATKAIDSVIAGYPANGAAEWSSAGQRTGAWIQLYWSTAQTIDRVYLYDRPNGSDQITGGTLTFSDGTTVTVPSLNNDGTATVITFTARATTTLRLTVTSVSSATGNVGLAEFEAYNGNPANGTAIASPAVLSTPASASPFSTASATASPSPTSTATALPSPTTTPATTAPVTSGASTSVTPTSTP